MIDETVSYNKVPTKVVAGGISIAKAVSLGSELAMGSSCQWLRPSVIAHRRAGQSGAGHE